MKIRVEVVYALPSIQRLLEVEIESPSTVREAVAASGMAVEFSEINLEELKVGIFGRKSNPDSVLSDGDRVEIYRGLVAEPKESRRRRAEHAKKMKR